MKKMGIRRVAACVVLFAASVAGLSACGASGDIDSSSALESTADVTASSEPLSGCAGPDACYTLNRVWAGSGFPSAGCPCKKAPGCTTPGHLVSKCDLYPSTCGYLYCVAD